MSQGAPSIIFSGIWNRMCMAKTEHQLNEIAEYYYKMVKTVHELSIKRLDREERDHIPKAPEPPKERIKRYRAKKVAEKRLESNPQEKVN